MTFAPVPFSVVCFRCRPRDGALDEGATVTWEFADFPGAFPVRVTKSVKNERIELEWASAEGGRDNHVAMLFESVDPESTQVKISETGWSETQKGLESSYGNCMGWTHMLCCLKAFLEYGINLRRGSF